MPRDGTGTYTRAVSAYVNGTIANATTVNTEIDDIATALTGSLAANGSKTWTGNQPAGGYKITGLAAGATNGDSVRYEQVLPSVFQSLDATLTTIAALTPTTDQFIYFTGSDTAAAGTVTSFARTLLDDADAAAARTTLGILGSGTPRGYIGGYTLSNNAGGTTAIDVAAGAARDSTNAQDILSSSAITNKILGTAWAAGNSQGMLDTGSVSDATYHIYAIRKDSDGSVDVLASLSASSPTMPAGYTYFRRIGSIVRSSGAIRLFVQDGDVFMWRVPVHEGSFNNPGTSAVTRTLSTPTGVRVRAIIVSELLDTANDCWVYYSDLSQTDSVVNATQLFSGMSTAAADYGTLYAQIFTNTSAQIRSRVNQSTSSTNVYLQTHGWIDTRGRES
jgi:hypothetical protein